MPHALVILDTGQALVRFLGRLHPAVVHFPIALLTVAALLELWQAVRRKPELARATPLCLVVGAVSAIVAALFGWFLDDSDGAGELMALHKWIGIASAGVAFVAALLLLVAAVSSGARNVFRVVLFTVAGLVGAAGYLGGELVFGRNHLFREIFGEEKPVVVATPVAAPAANPNGKINFTANVAPILEGYCLRCHGGDEVKGKVNLKTKADAFKARKKGACIVPGQPDESPLYTELVNEDVEHRMPPAKEKQLSPEQIATLRAWIEQGADWPEGVELK
jgi:uncharacterized membrane protein